MNNMNKYKNGYTAVSSVLVIGTVLLLIGLTLTLTTLNGLLTSFASVQGSKALYFVESCAEDALLYLNENNSLPASVTNPLGTCTVTLNSQVSNTWTFTTAGTINGHTKSIQIVADRTSTIAITSWTLLQ